MNKTSEVEFFEDAVGDVADDEHDGLPLEWDVEVVLFGGDGFDDGLGDLVDVGEFFAAFMPAVMAVLVGPGLMVMTVTPSRSTRLRRPPKKAERPAFEVP